ncbi:hypothetical protein INT47_008543 [Mucor saturninus]|uniref:Transposase Tc1-like domain-containing protein n=1 Tax=Mucor saturninus TaxID=64648 RepID=A0A8H7V1E1_9FUNG|nr:hypothetical protein INT47_008543 [Mucor saturninus]
MTITDSTNTHSKESGLTSESKLWGVYWLHKHGVSQSAISRTTELSTSTVHNILKRVKETGSPLPKKAPGASKKINERSQRALERVVRSKPTMSYNDLKMELDRADVNACRATVISSLKDMEFGSYFAAHKPRLTQKHRDRRLRWARSHVNWTKEQWESVVWSDESRFSVTGSDGGARVIRKVGERYQERNVIPTTKWGGGGVMIWGCFYKGGFGSLTKIDGTVNQEEYVNILAL